MMIKIKQNKIKKNKEKCTNSFAEKYTIMSLQGLLVWQITAENQYHVKNI